MAMKTLVKTLLGLLALLFVVALVIYFFFPNVLIDGTNANYARAAGLEVSTITVGGRAYPVYASAEPDSGRATVVLLHGLGDDRNSFLQAAESLAEDYNLLLPDLLGHGDNGPGVRDGVDYSIRGQAEFLHELLAAAGLPRVHLVGNSMGGHVAAAFALRYPEAVDRLVLVNAPGITLPDREVYTGFGDPIRDREGMRRVAGRIFHEVPDMPGPVMDQMIADINASMPFIDSTVIPAVKGGEDYDLTGRLSALRAPTLILWGKHDPVVDYGVAEYFDRHVPLSRVEIIDDASHSPQLERPAVVGAAIRNFLTADPTAMITSVRNHHAAKIQLYRWYTLYERDMTPARIDNQLDILAPDVTITSAAGEMKGRENYPARLKAYAGWRNAHHVQNIDVNPGQDGRTDLVADIIYQNVQPDGTENRYTVHYENTLKTTAASAADNLPRFTHLNLQPTGQLDPAPFVDAYPENRCRALMHAWLYNMEALDGKVDGFRELLADDFLLNFSTQSQITDIGQLETWLNGTPRGLNVSSHHPINFSVRAAEPGSGADYRMSVDFVWFGAAKDGKAYRTVTAHDWLVSDDPAERFARIKQADVRQKVPLAPL